MIRRRYHRPPKPEEAALFALSRTILSLVIDMLDTCRMKRGQDEATRQWAAVGLGICLLLTLLVLCAAS